MTQKEDREEWEQNNNQLLIAEYGGKKVEIWNSVTVDTRHEIRPEEVRREHTIKQGAGTTSEPPEYITPGVGEELWSIGVDPTPTVLDPLDEDVNVVATRG